MSTESAQPLTAQSNVQMAPFLADSAHQRQDLAVFRHRADGNAVGVPQYGAGQAAYARQHHSGGDAVLSADALDGQQQVVAPVQSPADGGHERTSLAMVQRYHTTPFAICIVL